MFRSRFGAASLIACFALLVILALVSHTEAQSHNDKYYKILDVPKDASPRQIKKVRVRKWTVLPAPFLHSLAGRFSLSVAQFSACKGYFHVHDTCENDNVADIGPFFCDATGVQETFGGKPS